MERLVELAQPVARVEEIDGRMAGPGSCGTECSCFDSVDADGRIWRIDLAEKNELYPLMDRFEATEPEEEDFCIR